MGFFNALFQVAIGAFLIAVLGFVGQLIVVLASGDPQWSAQKWLRRTVIVGGGALVLAVICAVIVVVGFLIGLFKDPVGALGDLLESLGLIDEPDRSGGLTG